MRVRAYGLGFGGWGKGSRLEFGPGSGFKGTCPGNGGAVDERQLAQGSGLGLGLGFRIRVTGTCAGDGGAVDERQLAQGGQVWV